MDEIRFRETTYLQFSLIGYSPSGKTKVFSVKNIKAGMIIGMVFWEGRFRKYGYHSYSDIIYDNNCLRDITEFLEDLMTEHKEKKQNERESE